MTPESQRIAIAEACGAKWGHPVFNHDGKWHVHFAKEPFEFDSSWAGKPLPFEDCVKDIDVPHYPTDLNAMHEAEKVLTPNQKREYVRRLIAIGKVTFDGYHATAAQRAEAFLRTLGLWKE